MTFTLYGTTFVDGSTPVPAAFLNKMRTELPSAVDGRGGSYTNTSLLKWTTSGAGLTIDGDSLITIASTGGLTISSEINGTLAYAAGSVAAYVNLAAGYADPTQWLFESTNPTTLTTAPRWKQQTNGPPGGPLLIPLDVPVGQTITGITARVKGFSGASGTDIPGTPPSIQLVWQDVTSLTLTSLGSQADPSTTVAGYNATHSIALTGLSEVVSSSRRYWVRLIGEAGIFTTGNMELHAIQPTLSIVSQTKWYG